MKKFIFILSVIYILSIGIILNSTNIGQKIVDNKVSILKSIDTSKYLIMLQSSQDNIKIVGILIAFTCTVLLAALIRKS